ncbi:MAG: nitrogenase component 1 [Elusimicrobiota bacterium]
MPTNSGRPMNFPTLIGVYLAVNAIADAYILVDGPDCTLYKAHFIHGRHDLNSTLLRSDGRHRVAFTNVCSRGVVKEHDDVIRRHLATLDGLDESGLVLVTALPMCSITGVDYGRLLRSDGEAAMKPAVAIPPDSLVGDWLDGYAQTLDSLARGLEIPPGGIRPGRVAVVGYFMDRNECDHAANLIEIRRMLGALGLETAAIWLEGRNAADLKRASEAEIIVSLPYGRAAACRIAQRTGARLVEAPLPFGIPKTLQFLRDVAEAAGCPAKAEAFIEMELSRLMPRLQRIVPHLFLHRKMAFMGDPHLADGFLDIADDLGVSISGTIVRGRRAHGGVREGGVVLYEPFTMSEEVSRLLQSPLDLFVSSWHEQGALPAADATMEFGFPSYTQHVLYERPFVGFNGFVSFVDRLAGELSARRNPRE